MKKELCIEPMATLREAIEKMDKAGFGAIFVADEKGFFKGLLTDGDVRRLILKGEDLKQPVQNVVNEDPQFVTEDMSRDQQLHFLKKIKRKHLPILNKERVLLDILLLDEIEFQANDTLVVIMAGGLGKRLAPLTDNCPKPMFELGGKPILEILLSNLIKYGFQNFLFAVNYKADVIKKHFGNGSDWNVKINYLHEKEKLGTAGALGLMENKPVNPFIVMNGDLITNVNFKSLLEFHAEHPNSAATVGVRKYEFQVPYGVVEHTQQKIKKVTEKPVHEFYVNAGIYVLDPKVLSLIKENQRVDMTELIDELLSKKESLSAFPIMEYWVDIGRADDLARAQSEFEKTSNSAIGTSAVDYFQNEE